MAATGGSASLRVMEDDAQGMTMAGTYPADPMAQVHPVNTARAAHRPVMDRENDAIAALQVHYFRPRLHAGTLFGQNKLSSGEIQSWPGEQKSRLERKDLLTIDILVQA